MPRFTLSVVCSDARVYITDYDTGQTWVFKLRAEDRKPPFREGVFIDQISLVKGDEDFFEVVTDPKRLPGPGDAPSLGSIKRKPKT